MTDRPPTPINAAGLIALAMICGTIVAIVWLVAR